VVYTAWSLLAFVGTLLQGQSLLPHIIIAILELLMT